MLTTIMSLNGKSRAGNNGARSHSYSASTNKERNINHFYDGMVRMCVLLLLLKACKYVYVVIIKYLYKHENREKLTRFDANQHLRQRQRRHHFASAQSQECMQQQRQQATASWQQAERADHLEFENKTITVAYKQ